MNSLLHLLVWIVPHFVAGDTESLGICYLHDPIKTAPEQNSTNAADDQQRCERKTRTRAPEESPDAQD
jgi:hypothetical protein